MTFFNKVIANESKNRMSLWNISTVMAPNLFFSRSKHSDYEELLLANTAAHIIRLMLKYQKILWKVSDIVMTGPPQKSMSPGNIKPPWLGNSLGHREEIWEDNPRWLWQPYTFWKGCSSTQFPFETGIHVIFSKLYKDNATIPGSRIPSDWEELPCLKTESAREVEFKCFPSSPSYFSSPGSVFLNHSSKKNEWSHDAVEEAAPKCQEAAQEEDPRAGGKTANEAWRLSTA